MKAKIKLMRGTLCFDMTQLRVLAEIARNILPDVGTVCGSGELISTITSLKREANHPLPPAVSDNAIVKVRLLYGKNL
jgi:hypothetical protein